MLALPSRARAASGVGNISASGPPPIHGDPVTMLHGVSGPVAAGSHRVKFKVSGDAANVRLVYSTDSSMQTGLQYSEPQDLDASNNWTADFTLTGLTADTEYFWAPWSGGVLATFQSYYGRFRTAPVGPKTFSIAFSSCNQYSGADPEDGTVWDHIRGEEPDLFFHLDDFHYGDISAEDVDVRVQADEEVLGMPRQGACYMRVPLVRGVGDHDFCGNDSWRGSTGAAEARQAYLLTMPHPPLDGANQDATQGQWFALTWGRVRILKIDGRSYRDHRTTTPSSSKTMLGATQKTWFKAAIDQAAIDLAAGDIGLVLVAGDVPWTGSGDGEADHWEGYSHEREELAEYIEQAGVTGNLYWIVGDMHRMGYDDGTNTRFSTTNSGSPAFPSACGGSLGNAQGLVKGTWSDVEGSAGENRVGFLTITDAGGTSITVDTSLRAVNTGDTSHTEPLGTIQDVFSCVAYGA